MTVATLTAVGIGHMLSESPNLNVSGRTGFFPTGHFSTPQTNRAWLMFDMHEIPSDAVVSNVDLKITVQNNFLGTSHTINIYRLKRKCWRGTGSPPLFPDNEGSWNNYRQDLALAWTTPGASDTTNDRDAATIGTLAVTSATSGTQTIPLSTALVKEWLDGTFVNNGILLQASVESGSDTLIRWLTIDDATPSNRPQLVVTYTSAMESLTLMDNIVAYYKQEDTGWADAHSTHDLTPVNAPTVVAGKIGNAAHFVGASNQALTNSDVALRRADADWTIGFWVKLTDLTSLYTAISQLTVSGVSGAGVRVFYHQDTIIPHFVAQLNDPTGTAQVADAVGYNVTPVAGTYYGIIVRHDAVRNFLDIIINDNAPNFAPGAAASEQWGHYTNTYQASADDFMVGGQSDGTQDFNGDIDEIGIWDRWLTAIDITAWYAAGAGNQYPFGVTSTKIPNIMNSYRRRRTN